MVPRRLLVLIVILYVLWRILVAVGNRQRRTAARADDFSRFSARRRDRFRDEGETLAPCDRCGVHVPESWLVAGRSGRYCGEACREAAQRGDSSPGDRPDAG